MLRLGYYNPRANVRISFSNPGIRWAHHAEIWCIVRASNHVFNTGHKWMISTSAQVQPNILLKAHLFVSARLSPKWRLTGIMFLAFVINVS